MNSSPISWSSRKQNLVATSTTNAEYVALSEATCEAIWLQKLISDLRFDQIHYYPATLHCDNTGALALAHQAAHNKRSKHIDLKYHHIRDHVNQGTVILNHVKSNENIADGYTKSLSKVLFNNFIKQLTRTSKDQYHQINVISTSPKEPDEFCHTCQC